MTSATLRKVTMSDRLFFGERWDAPSHDDATQIETPVGHECYMCDREIVEGDQGWLRLMIPKGTTGVVHLGCEMGTTIGHTFGYCDCNGWTDYYWRGKALLQYFVHLSHCKMPEVGQVKTSQEIASIIISDGP